MSLHLLSIKTLRSLFACEFSDNIDEFLILNKIYNNVSPNPYMESVVELDNSFMAEFSQQITLVVNLVDLVHL